MNQLFYIFVFISINAYPENSGGERFISKSGINREHEQNDSVAVSSTSVYKNFSANIFEPKFLS